MSWLRSRMRYGATAELRGERQEEAPGGAGPPVAHATISSEASGRKQNVGSSGCFLVPIGRLLHGWCAILDMVHLTGVLSWDEDDKGKEPRSN